MSGRAYGVTDGSGGRAARLLPAPRGGGTRLQQEPGQTGQKHPVETQRAEAKVSVTLLVVSAFGIR